MIYRDKKNKNQIKKKIERKKMKKTLNIVTVAVGLHMNLDGFVVVVVVIVVVVIFFFAALEKKEVQ